jgi:hypothetical protein
MSDATSNTPATYLHGTSDAPLIVEVPVEPARLDQEAAARLLRLLLDLPKKRPR